MTRKLRLNSFASLIRYPGIIVSSFEIRSILLDDLFCPCGVVPGFTEELVKSVKKDGLKNPVIVVRLSTEDYLSHCKEHGLSIKRVPTDRATLNVVWGGNNRVETARILGFDAIDCVMMPNFDLAMDVQGIHRTDYSKHKREALAKKG